jgi:ABC-2 type transport system ATP-binding protein
LSSHLLRDVEECCDEILVLKDGQIAANCNLEEERNLNRKFIELETRGGDRRAFAEAVGNLGCEYALSGERRMKLVMNETIEISDLYRLALENSVQIRRLNFKRDSLEDIFLKAMENGDAGASVNNENGNGRINDGGL